MGIRNLRIPKNVVKWTCVMLFMGATDTWLFASLFIFHFHDGFEFTNSKEKNSYQPSLLTHGHGEEQQNPPPLHQLHWAQPSKMVGISYATSHSDCHSFTNGHCKQQSWLVCLCCQGWGERSLASCTCHSASNNSAFSLWNQKSYVMPWSLLWLASYIIFPLVAKKLLVLVVETKS